MHAPAQLDLALRATLAKAVQVAAVAFGGAAGPEAFEARGGLALFGGEAAALYAGCRFAVEGLGDGGGTALFRKS